MLVLSGRGVSVSKNVAIQQCLSFHLLAVKTRVSSVRLMMLEGGLNTLGGRY